MFISQLKKLYKSNYPANAVYMTVMTLEFSITGFYSIHETIFILRPRVWLLSVSTLRLCTAFQNGDSSVKEEAILT